MSDSTKISIIIPVYNAEKYIQKCIDSVLCQTLQDFEIIFINDGSTDNTIKILNEYADKDDRIIVLNQQNQGQGSARNLGIQTAKGEYIYFMDQDDRIDKDLFETAYNKGVHYDADIIEVPYLSEFGTECRLNKLKFKIYYNKTFDYRINKNYLFGTSLAGWSRFVKRELIIRENIQFSTYRSLEDYIYTIKAKIYAKKIICIKDSYYHYTIRKNSDLNSTKSYKKESVNALLEIKQLLEETSLYESYKKEFINISIDSLVDIYKHIPNENKKNFLQSCEKLLEKNYAKFIKCLKNNNRAFFQQIFSLKNVYNDGKKKKYCTILNKEYIIGDSAEKISDIPKILVHFHLYYHEQLDYFINKMKNITDCDWDLYVTYVDYNEESNRKILEFKPDAKLIHVENRGYDIWPFISVIKSINLDDYDFVLKIHTKSCREKLRFKHIKRSGFWWRNELINTLLKSKHRFKKILNLFNEKEVGMIFSDFLLGNLTGFLPEKITMLSNELSRLGIKTDYRHWCAGTMFIARSKVFKFLQSELIDKNLFTDNMQTGSNITISHVYEIILGIEVVESGFEIKTINNRFYDLFTELYKVHVQPIVDWIFSLNKINNQKILTVFGFKFVILRTNKIRN